MAQVMTLTCSFCGQARTSTPLKTQPLSFNPNYSSSHLFFSPLPPRFSSSSSSPLTPFALFKSKTKAPPSQKVEKPKTRVEDGIFGTSGGIGFTKQNELFVGRVAMLGFARHRTAQPLVAAAQALSLLLGSATAAHGEEVGVRSGGAALFNRACIGCHDAGGNVIQPGATLFAGDLEWNGVATEEEIFRVTYLPTPGKGECLASARSVRREGNALLGRV